MSNNIKPILKSKDLKVTDLIKGTGLARSFVYDIINDNSVPTIKTARLIADYLEVGIDEIFPNEKEKTENQKIEELLRTSL